MVILCNFDVDIVMFVYSGYLVDWLKRNEISFLVRGYVRELILGAVCWCIYMGKNNPLLGKWPLWSSRVDISGDLFLDILQVVLNWLVVMSWHIHCQAVDRDTPMKSLLSWPERSWVFDAVNDRWVCPWPRLLTLHCLNWFWNYCYPVLLI